jgi:hypothetical protein
MRRTPHCLAFALLLALAACEGASRQVASGFNEDAEPAIQGQPPRGACDSPLSPLSHPSQSRPWGGRRVAWLTGRVWRG